jgi:hypothetical protein
MKKISSSIAATVAGLALSLGGAGVALAGGEPDPYAQPDPYAEQELEQEESLIEGVEPQQLSGSFDEDTSDDWFYDTYEIGERQPLAEQPQLEEPQLEEPRFELDEELTEQQQELERELEEQAFGQEREDLFDF